MQGLDFHKHCAFLKIKEYVIEKYYKGVWLILHNCERYGTRCHFTFKETVSTDMICNGRLITQC